MAIERGYLLPSFHTAIEETLPTELKEGLLGWRVIDCVVTLTNGRFSAPTPPAGYFRQLTATALRKALSQAGTTVCEPFSEIEVEFPAQTMSRVLQKLTAAGITPAESTLGPDRGRIIGTMPTASVHGFEQRLPDLTQGEGVFLSRPGGYRPVQGTPPAR
jgi:ribosomal protection tetracycline resistance protein